MAYDPDNPPSLLTQGIGGTEGLRFFGFMWTDEIADLLVPGYIENAAEIGMRAGDSLVYMDTNRGEWCKYGLIVSEVDEITGAATLAFPEIPEEALPYEETFDAEDPNTYVIMMIGGRQVRVDVSQFALDTMQTASVAEAKAGAVNDKRMTPLRVRQAIDAWAQYHFSTPILLLADTTMTYAAGDRQVTVGEIVEAGGHRYEIAASGATTHHVTTAGGIKLTIENDIEFPLSAFGCINDTGVTDNAAAIQAAYTAASAAGHRSIRWDGRYGFGTTINILGSVSTFGTHVEALGSAGPRPSAMYWLGGAAPMLQINASRTRFYGLTLKNQSQLATDWIAYGEGAIYPVLDDIDINLPLAGNRFSRSVIYSDGIRLGYGEFYRLNWGGSAAPKIFFLDGTNYTGGNKITTMKLYNSVITSSSVASTVFYFKGMGAESLTIEGCSFNNNSGDQTLVDTTDNLDYAGNPIEDVLYTLNFHKNEIDHIGSDPTNRKFKLKNVRNINFTDNEASMGGQVNGLFALTNSHVTRDQGNSVRSLGGQIFEFLDAPTSTYTNGANRAGTTGTPPPNTLSIEAATRRRTASATTHILDNMALVANGINLWEINLDGAFTPSIRANITQITAGTVVTIIIRNISAGAISYSFFATHFTTAAAIVLPAAGFSQVYTFYHNGTNFIELSRGATTVAN